ncbi:hypothetical protein DL764_003440 [Monosporascus ibericus]|uniref:Rhodopsin domain-containing protein n=1 Tax=Monosporascus ibericus TaxID=155417 RepID=A0A4Q4TK79_9PEZI|nr:hypothetical protein DL764_003440 [Monosporascus ibericus]
MSTAPGFVTHGVITYLPAPEGYDVDFENPQRQYLIQIYSVAAVGNPLVLFFLSQRLYTKIFLARGLQIDDVATQILVIRTFAIGSQGVHAWEIPIETFEKFRLHLYIAAPTFVPCASLAKLALLVFYLRLSPQRWFHIAVWSTIGTIAVYSLIIIFGLIFVCNPVRMAFTVTEIAEGSCIQQPALFTATAIANTLTDVILFGIPIPMVWDLEMPRTQKFGVVFVFAVGSITVVTSVVRACILPELLTNPDETWATAPASFWVLLELNLLIICGAMPTLRRFLNHVAPSLMRSSGHSPRTDANTPRTRPFGTSGKRRKQYYARFGSSREEDEVEFETLSRMGAKKHKNGEGSTAVVIGAQTATVETGVEASSWDARARGKDNNEKAIVTTKTVTIQYERDLTYPRDQDGA